jgi:hypothetical protein
MPTKSAPQRAVARASSVFVTPQILTRMPSFPNEGPD